MVATPTRLALDEFLKLPDEKPALEFEEGMVTQKVSPKGQHSWLQAALCELLNGFASKPRLGRAFPELRTTFGGRSYVPDVALYRWERVPRYARGRVANDFREPPDLVVEIVSPEQSTNSLVRRCLWFVANGVRVALLVDPADDSILVFRPNTVPAGHSGADPIDLGDVVTGLALIPEQVFGALDLGER